MMAELDSKPHYHKSHSESLREQVHGTMNPKSISYHPWKPGAGKLWAPNQVSLGCSQSPRHTELLSPVLSEAQRSLGEAGVF